MNCYILTGSSKGLGRAVAIQLCNKNHTLFCISRKQDDELIAIAASKNCTLHYLEYDLRNTDGISELVERIFSEIRLSEADKICLINNAGTLNPIKPVGKFPSSEMITNIQVNALAPMILISEFIRRTQGYPLKRVVLNVSSGAGRNPYFGWGCYCSAKAAIDMFTKCVGAEQLQQDNPVRIISFAPGIMDTDMQKQIRKSQPDDFEQVERFKRFKEEGKLKQPDFVAEKVLELIDNDEIKSGTVMDIRELI